MTEIISSRRQALAAVGVGLAASLIGPAQAAPTMLPTGANSLAELSATLEKVSRRRDYKSVPMVLDNPDKPTHEAMAAELTNHLVSGVVLTPGAVGTLVELTDASFSFAK